MYMHLHRFYLSDSAPQHSFKSPKEKAIPKRRGWQTGSVDLYVRGAWLTEWAPRDRRWLPAPSWCDGWRALSGTLLPTARQSWSSTHNPRDFAPRGKGSTSSMSAPEGETTKAPIHTSLNHTSDPSLGPHGLEPHELEPHQLERKEDQDKRQRHHPKLASCPPYISWGSALRSSPFSAPPPFELLREASRKGACPLAPLPARRAGDGGSQFWLRSKEIIPPKRGPRLT